jgi:hypothetical protein
LHDVPNVKNFSHRFLIVNLFVSETMCRAWFAIWLLSLCTLCSDCRSEMLSNPLTVTLHGAWNMIDRIFSWPEESYRNSLNINGFWFLRYRHRCHLNSESFRLRENPGADRIYVRLSLLVREPWTVWKVQGYLILPWSLCNVSEELAVCHNIFRQEVHIVPTDGRMAIDRANSSALCRNSPSGMTIFRMAKWPIITVNSWITSLFLHKNLQRIYQRSRKTAWICSTLKSQNCSLRKLGIKWTEARSGTG